MRKIINKIRTRNIQFQNHPITKDNRAKALYRYIIFNVISRTKNTINYKWIGPLMFTARKGEAGIVGNIYFGLYEFNESTFLLHFLNSNDTFLDVGSNVGHYTLLASGIKNCKTISIEPIPNTYIKLRDHIHLNNLFDKVVTLNIGISNIPSQLHFSTDKNTMNRIVDSNYKNAVTIPVNTIDNICHNQNIRLIKIDVEGYEKFALEGAKHTLANQNLKAIIIELNHSSEFYGVNNDDIFKALTNFDFHPYKYCPFTRTLTKLNSYNKEQFNTIFIRDINFVTTRILKSPKIKIWNKLL